MLADENVDLMFDLGCVGMIVKGLSLHKAVRGTWPGPSL